eukprot:40790_1
MTIKYSRSKKQLKKMKKQTPLTMNGLDIPQFDDESEQIQEFLGFHHNFDKQQFEYYHFQYKIDTFTGLLHNYKNKLRNAIIYGLKLIPFTKKK